MNDVEFARIKVMRELAAKIRRQKIYDDSKIEAAKKIGEYVKGMVEEEDFGIGTYDPYLKKYVRIMDSAERSEAFNEEHANDKGSGVAGGIEPGTGELVDRESQPDTWDPYSRIWKKAGDK